MSATVGFIHINPHKIVKLFSVASVALLPPTLIASIYGMNVELPLQHSPHAFLIPMLISVVLSGVAITVCVFKKWL